MIVSIAQTESGSWSSSPCSREISPSHRPMLELESSQFITYFGLLFSSVFVIISSIDISRRRSSVR